MEDVFIIGDAPLWIVGYYFVMWLINTCGYVLTAYSFFRLARIAAPSRFRQPFTVFGIVIACFGAIRGVSGFVGMYRFVGMQASTTATVELLGVVSLFLNTTFICTFGTIAFVEYRKLARIKRKNAALVKGAIHAFEQLKAATKKSSESGN